MFLPIPQINRARHFAVLSTDVRVTPLPTLIFKQEITGFAAGVIVLDAGEKML